MIAGLRDICHACPVCDALSSLALDKRYGYESFIATAVVRSV